MARVRRNDTDTAHQLDLVRAVLTRRKGGKRDSALQDFAAVCRSASARTRLRMKVDAIAKWRDTLDGYISAAVDREHEEFLYMAFCEVARPDGEMDERDRELHVLMNRISPGFDADHQLVIAD